ncbi:putative bifunctional diguanylate cyclase/phosphodiesterase [Pseudoduganella sp. RAF53_2]|uniref:putative bifunctional diguanylate cyclase/phosphodiesterase n=1 Tax=unclassified Pseudoduganella TaxID=2637179 RepID=UPI003F985A21
MNVQNSNIAVWELDAAWRTVGANPAAIALAGPEAALCFAAEDWLALTAELSAGRPFFAELRLRSQDSSERPCQVCALPGGLLLARPSSEALGMRQLASLHAMNEISAIAFQGFGDQMHGALAIGARLLGLPVGTLSRVEGEHATPVAWLPPGITSPGRMRALGDSCCATAFRSAVPFTARAAAGTGGLLHSCVDLALHAYIGVRIEVAGAPWGVLSFGAVAPFARSFDEGDDEFISLLGRWIGGAIERAAAGEKLLLAASVFDNVREGIIITDPAGTIVNTNEAFTRIAGYTADEVRGRNPSMLQSGRQPREFYAAMWQRLREQGYWQGEVWNRRKSGEVYAELLTITAIRNQRGEVEHYVGLFSDITRQKEHERELERIANYDALTGLPNRRLLADRLHQALALSQRNGSTLAVVYLDLDGFKTVNDVQGHEYGDELLIAVAQRMKQSVRDSDTVGRLGGDEFVAVLQDLPEGGACLPFLARLLDACARPVTIDGRLLQVSASIGVALYPQNSEVDADQLMRQADQAMYEAKLAGKNRFHIFDAEQQRSTINRNEQLDGIRRALADGEFVLYYQPIVDLRQGRVMAAEALIRWLHPQRGLLSPAEFLPLIEDDPLAVQVGEWVLGEALRQQERWQDAGLHIVSSVNIGSWQLQQPDFVPRLKAMLDAHPHVAPSRLKLEVLETSALEDIAHVSRVISDCAALGVSFALDDFGTGYSSLLYLKRLPAAQIKIDQSFVRNMLEDPDDLAILQGVLGLASAFHREPIAEGVESEAHARMLLQLGCRLAQGYGIARPMPAQDMPAWVAHWRPAPGLAAVLPLAQDALPLLAAQVEYRAWARRLSDYLDGAVDQPPEVPAALACLQVLVATRALTQAVQLQASQLVAHRRGHRTTALREGREGMRVLLAQLGAQLVALLEAAPARY